MNAFFKTAIAAPIAAAGLIAFTPAPALHAAGLVLERAEARLDSDLRVRVTGLSSSQGQVWIGVYANAEAYAAGEEAVQATLPADQNGVATVFDALPAGEYAVIAFHDANANNDFDRNFLGMPTERFGFSNLSPRMRRARWDEAVFAHDGAQTVTVNLVGAGG